MKLTKQTADTASYLAVETLGLDPDAVGLTSTEGVAVSLRRAASFMCPTSPGRLVDAVLGALRPLDGDDLQRHESGRSTRLLFLAPPSFIERVPGTYLLMGVRPFGAPLISDELAGAIEYEGHTRLLTLEPADYEKELRARGLQQVPKKRWIASPSVEAPADLIKQHRSRLNVAADAGELEGLVRCEAGVPMRILEFPVADPVVPGRDEAWRYQAAIDALRGTPQEFRIRRGARPSDDAILDFFSPLPGFAERYVQFAGLALGKSTGSLFSFRLPPEALDDVTKFLTDMLWMTYQEDSSGD